MRSQARNNITQDTKAQSEYDTGVGGVPLGKYQQVKQLESEYGQEGADAVGLARLFKELTLTFGRNWTRGLREIFDWKKQERTIREQGLRR